MIITYEDLLEIYEDKDFSKFSKKRLELKLRAIESAIRRYTHNKFLNRNISTQASCSNGVLRGNFQYFQVGDTVSLSGLYKDELYVVESCDLSTMTVDDMVFDVDSVVVTKVEYPQDVIDGAIELLDYDINRRAQAQSGISSETISRHSVSYKNYSEANTIEGYPSEMMGFLRKYIEWRT